jgi:hypothetical protein
MWSKVLMPVLTGRVKKTGDRVIILASLDEDAYDPHDQFFSRSGTGYGRKGHVIKNSRIGEKWYPAHWIEITHIDGARIKPTGGSNGNNAVR